MLRKELEKYLNKLVKVVLFDGTVIVGILERDKYSHNIYKSYSIRANITTKNFESGKTMNFKCSHVTNLELFKEE